MPTQSLTAPIEQIAKSSVTTVQAQQIQINATRLRINQTIIPLANIAKVAQVKIYKAFPTQQLLILGTGLTILLGLRPTILIDQAKNVLSAGLILWMIYLFFDHQGWRDQHGLLVVSSAGSNGAIVVVHENPDFIGQTLGAIEQVIDKSASAYSIDWSKQTIEAR